MTRTILFGGRRSSSVVSASPRAVRILLCLGLAWAGQQTQAQDSGTRGVEGDSVVAATWDGSSPGKSIPQLDDGTVWRRHSEINTGRVLGVVGLTAAQELWYLNWVNDNWHNVEAASKRFYFKDVSQDWRAAKQMDKAGHMYMSYMLAHAYSLEYRWMGLSATQSAWLGGLTGYLAMFQVEMFDGFSGPWGFSTLDFTANTLGVGYAVVQQLYPNRLRGVRLKFSYRPSAAYREGRLGASWKSTYFDDYDGHTYWIAVNAYDVMPVGVQDRFPKWLVPLGLAVGYGADGLAQDWYGGQREIVLGLDIDLTKLPVGDRPAVKYLMNALNFIRWPLPAATFRNDGVHIGWYF